MTVLYSPLTLEMLIHFYVSPEPHPKQSLPVAQEAIDRLLDLALLAYKSDALDAEKMCFVVTSKGRAHIQQILTLPLPAQCWVGADGAVLDVGQPSSAGAAS